MTYASIEEAWGSPFKPSKKKTKKSKKKKISNSQRNDSQLNTSLIEQFEDFSSNVNMNSNISGNQNKENNENNENENDLIYEVSPAEESLDYSEVYGGRDLDGIDSNNLHRIVKNDLDEEDNDSVFSDDLRIQRQPELENTKNETCDIKDEIKKMNSKINYILNKIDSKEGFKNLSSNEGSNNNLYDIVLFILLGLFIIIIIESINKLALRGSEEFVCVPKIKLPKLDN